MATLKDQLKELAQQSALRGKELKAALRELIRETWPDLPPWTTLAAPIIEEVQKATVGCGVVLTFSENGVQKVVLAEAGDHYSQMKGTGPAFTIPGGFINLSATPGSALVPASSAPEDSRVGAAREVEEELRKPDGSPLLQVNPSRLKPMDTKTIAFPNGEKRIVLGFMLELDADEITTVKEHVAKLTADPAYKAAATGHSINHDTARREVSDVSIFTLADVANGSCKLLHEDQLSLFRIVEEHFRSLAIASGQTR